MGWFFHQLTKSNPSQRAWLTRLQLMSRSLKQVVSKLNGEGSYIEIKSKFSINHRSGKVFSLTKEKQDDFKKARWFFHSLERHWNDTLQIYYLYIVYLCFKMVSLL